MGKLKNLIAKLVILSEQEFKSILLREVNIIDIGSDVINYLTDVVPEYKIKKHHGINYVFFTVMMNRKINSFKKVSIFKTNITKQYIIYIENIKSTLKNEYYIALDNNVLLEAIEALVKNEDCGC